MLCRIHRVSTTTDVAEVTATDPITLEQILAQPLESQKMFKFAMRDRRQIDGPSALRHLAEDARDWV